jgi:hypothetical protein
MSNRLDQEREQRLQPQRIKSCKAVLENLGFEVRENGNTELQFMFKGGLVKFWPYSGWHSGKTIQDGRGFTNLLNQIK